MRIVLVVLFALGFANGFCGCFAQRSFVAAAAPGAFLRLRRWPANTRPPPPAAAAGAIAGVGMWEGRRGFNGRLFAKFCAGWVITIIAVVIMTMAFTAQGLYRRAPRRAVALCY